MGAHCFGGARLDVLLAPLAENFSLCFNLVAFRFQLLGPVIEVLVGERVAVRTEEGAPLEVGGDGRGVVGTGHAASGDESAAA